MPRTQFLTAKFKVHNPSQRKRRILDQTLREYTLAYQALLDWAREHLDEIAAKGKYRDKYSEMSIRAALPPMPFLKEFAIHSSAKHSVLVDVSGTLTSYFELKATDPNTAFPTCRNPNPRTYPDALDRLAQVLDDEGEFRQRQAELTRVARGAFMPVYFARPDAVPKIRNFSLLVDDITKKFYAILFVLPGDSSEGCTLQTRGNLRRLGYPRGAREAETAYFLDCKTKSALVLPLEMARWHREKFLTPAMGKTANIRSAFLSKAGDEYFLHVTFEYEPEQITPETVLGVDRGMTNLVALTVLAKDGAIIKQHLEPGKELVDYHKYVFTEYRRRQRKGKDLTGMRLIARRNEEVCHRIANLIVAEALQHRSQVVVENLQGMKERKRDWPLLKRSPMQRIQEILTYKLSLAGLPEPVTVSPAWTSLECPQCGSRDKGNRPNKRDATEYRCVSCGYTTHADLNGSHNIGRRWLAILDRRESTLTA